MQLLSKAMNLEKNPTMLIANTYRLCLLEIAMVNQFTTTFSTKLRSLIDYE